MANDRIPVLDPRLAGFAQTMARSFPMPVDAEAKVERHLCRHIDHKAAVK